MNSKHPLSDSEIALFRAAVRDVIPLTQDKIEPVSNRSKRKTVVKTLPLLSNADSRDVAHRLRDPSELGTITAESYLQFSRPGISKKQLRCLRQGKLIIQAVLDLHGQTVEQARKQLIEFLSICQQHQYKQILIIHGKAYRAADGYARIKTYLHTWLPQLPNVLAYCSAQAKDGGLGALYVLLRL